MTRPALSRALALMLGLILAVVAPPAQAEGYSPAAQRVLGKAFAATGGRSW